MPRRERGCLKKLKRKRGDELSQVMGHSGLKMAKMKGHLHTSLYIQHHRAVQPQTAIPSLARAPSGLQTTSMDMPLCLHGKSSQQNRSL